MAISSYTNTGGNMWQYVYRGLTVYAGMYLCYLLPIGYSIVIFYAVLSSKLRRGERLRGYDLLVAIALMLVSVDFARYLYLWLTHTGRLLPSMPLVIKYVVGGCLWLGIGWYAYTFYFCRRTAGELFGSRRMTLIGICVGSLILTLIGMIAS
jgi:hypothetical protein